jgi:hypothetical protein
MNKIVNTRDGVRVIFRGVPTLPSFQSDGAAQAYLDALIAGTRRPEYAGPVTGGR